MAWLLRTNLTRGSRSCPLAEYEAIPPYAAWSPFIVCGAATDPLMDGTTEGARMEGRNRTLRPVVP